MKKRQQEGQSHGYFNDRQLISILFDLWSEGFEKTTTTLKWAILLMMRYPDIQNKVHQELDQVFGSAKKIPTVADKPHLPYTNAVLQEVLRYSNVVPSNYGRVLTKDTVIKGFILPLGTVVVPQISVVHIDDKIFNNPNEFDPERFLIGGKHLKSVDELIPFSVGKRSCLGESLARMVLYIVFTNLFYKYKFTLVPNDLHAEPTQEPVGMFIAKPPPFQYSITAKF